MFYLRDLLNAHFSGWTGRAHAIDDIRLPRWLDRRLGWNRARDRERWARSERVGRDDLDRRRAQGPGEGR